MVPDGPGVFRLDKERSDADTAKVLPDADTYLLHGAPRPMTSEELEPLLVGIPTENHERLRELARSGKIMLVPETSDHRDGPYEGIPAQDKTTVFDLRADGTMFCPSPTKEEWVQRRNRPPVGWMEVVAMAAPFLIRGYGGMGGMRERRPVMPYIRDVETVMAEQSTGTAAQVEAALAEAAEKRKAKNARRMAAQLRNTYGRREDPEGL